MGMGGNGNVESHSRTSLSHIRMLHVRRIAVVSVLTAVLLGCLTGVMNDDDDDNK